MPGLIAIIDLDDVVGNGQRWLCVVRLAAGYPCCGHFGCGDHAAWNGRDCDRLLVAERFACVRALFILLFVFHGLLMVLQRCLHRTREVAKIHFADRIEYILCTERFVVVLVGCGRRIRRQVHDEHRCGPGDGDARLLVHVHVGRQRVLDDFRYV